MKPGEGERLGDKGYPSPAWERKVTEAFTEAIAFLQSEQFLDSHCFADQPIQEAINEYRQLRNHYRFLREEEIRDVDRQRYDADSRAFMADSSGIYATTAHPQYRDVGDENYVVRVARWRS
jgi:hypothetical protein